MKVDTVVSLWCALALTDLRLKFLPHRWNRELLLADTPAAAPRLADADRKDEILNLANLVRSAARHRLVFNMSCLRQALVLRSQLQARGIQAFLVYGARKDAASFGAHAWVEAGNMRLDGFPDQRFHRFKG